MHGKHFILPSLLLNCNGDDDFLSTTYLDMTFLNTTHYLKTCFYKKTLPLHRIALKIKLLGFFKSSLLQTSRVLSILVNQRSALSDNKFHEQCKSLISKRETISSHELLINANFRNSLTLF